MNACKFIWTAWCQIATAGDYGRLIDDCRAANHRLFVRLDKHHDTITQLERMQARAHKAEAELRRITEADK